MATITQLKSQQRVTRSQPADDALPSLEQLRNLANEASLIRAREHRGYSVYQVNDRYIYKRYHYPLSRRLLPKEREWEIENTVLTALSDLPGIPRSYGIHFENRHQEQVYHCLREYIPGQPVTGFNRSKTADAGRLIASLHARLVTTNDPQAKNFVCDDRGRLFFTDFGKATLFKRRSLLFYARVARELFRFMYAAIHRESRLWRIFLIHYYQGVDYSRMERLLIRLFFSGFYLHRSYRNLHRGRPLLD